MSIRGTGESLEMEALDRLRGGPCPRLAPKVFLGTQNSVVVYGLL